MIAPGEPNGTSPLDNWLRKLLRYSRANEVKPGFGYRVKRGLCGTVLEIEPARGGGSTTTAQLLKITDVHKEYLVCHTWDGTTEGTDSIYVAKPFKLRETLTGETIDGIAVTYTYTSSGFSTWLIRTARATIEGVVTSERQLVVPRYLVGDKIYAIQASSVALTEADGHSVSLIDLNVDGRAWARRYRQT